MKSFIMLVVAAMSLLTLCVSSAPAEEQAKEVRVAAFVIPPFVVQENGALSGFSIELWNAIALQLNIKTSYQIVPDIGALEETMRLEKADLIASPVVITLRRVEKFDFSLPILQSGLQIMVRDTGEPIVHFGPLGYLLDLLFSGTALVWLGIALLLVLIPAHLVWILERRHKNGIISTTNYFPGIFEAIYWALACLSTQAETMPRQWFARALAVIWMFVGVVFVASYTAQLTTALTIRQIKGTIRGPEDLPGASVGTVANTVAASYLRSHDARVQTFDRPEQMFQALLDNKVAAVVSESPVVRYFASHEGKGRVKLVGTEFETAPLAILFRLNSPLRRKVDIALFALRENGTYQELYIKWFGTP